MYKAVIFDLDGTILNTLDDLYYSTNYALEKFNLPKRTYEEIRCFVGNGVKVLIEKAVGENNLHLVDNVILEFKNHYQVHSLDHIRKYDGIDEVLTTLKNSGIKLAVVTNKFNLAAQDIVSKYFPNIFDYVLGESSDLKRKPYPDMCNFVLNKLEVNTSETLYVGDSDVDILTAQNSNLKCLSCSWGFKTKEELISYNANVIIDNPCEILNYIKK